MHDSNPRTNASDDPLKSANTRIGLILFFAYTAVYAAFVLVSAFRPVWMAQTLAGVNFAVLSGFGLIVGAILLAAIYLWLCRPSQRKQVVATSRQDA